MGVTRSRYLAFLSEDPAKLAEFYCKYLQLQELGRSTPGDVSLTDRSGHSGQVVTFDVSPIILINRLIVE